MALSNLPVPPQRSDPANFAARGDAFMAALPTFVSEFNAQVPNVVAGDQGITGNLVVNGNSTLGNATTDTVNIGVGAIVKDSAGNVGVGVSSPATQLHVKTFFSGSNTRNGAIRIEDFSSTAYAMFDYIGGLSMYDNAVYTTSGQRKAVSTLSSGVSFSAGNTSFYNNSGLTAGVDFTPTERLRIQFDGHIASGTDNAQTLGTAAKRWSVVYAGTGTINTSDAREKTKLVSLSENETKAAIALSKEIGTYKWLASVQDKGASARKHIGLTVQRAIEILEAHNLSAFDYGFICWDEWTDAEGNTQDRYGFRYDELSMFIAAGISARLDALEAKVV